MNFAGSSDHLYVYFSLPSLYVSPSRAFAPADRRADGSTPSSFEATAICARPLPARFLLPPPCLRHRAPRSESFSRNSRTRKHYPAGAIVLNGQHVRIRSPTRYAHPECFRSDIMPTAPEIHENIAPVETLNYSAHNHSFVRKFVFIHERPPRGDLKSPAWPSGPMSKSACTRAEIPPSI